MKVKFEPGKPCCNTHILTFHTESLLNCKLIFLKLKWNQVPKRSLKSDNDCGESLLSRTLPIASLWDFFFPFAPSLLLHDNEHPALSFQNALPIITLSSCDYIKLIYTHVPWLKEIFRQSTTLSNEYIYHQETGCEIDCVDLTRNAHYPKAKKVQGHLCILLSCLPTPPTPNSILILCLQP